MPHSQRTTDHWPVSSVQLGPTIAEKGPKRCPREHALSGYNRMSAGSCRACHAAFMWAKRHNRFNDDPQVVEHANQVYDRYLADHPSTEETRA
jgi:hypothetical protein